MVKKSCTLEAKPLHNAQLNIASALDEFHNFPTDRSDWKIEDGIRFARQNLKDAHDQKLITNQQFGDMDKKIRGLSNDFKKFKGEHLPLEVSAKWSNIRSDLDNMRLDAIVKCECNDKGKKKSF